LADDPERSILITLVDDQRAHTPEVEDALRRALQASHIRLLLSQPGAKILTAEFSPDGALIVTTNSIGEARVWNAHDGALGPLLRGASDIRSAQFSPDGRFILTLSTHQTATMWDTSSGSTVSSLEGHGVDFTTAQFGPTADIIALGGTDGNVRLWYWYAHGISDTEVYSGNIGNIRALEWSADRILATGNTGLTVWDRWSGMQLYTVANTLTQTEMWDAHLSFGTQLVMANSTQVRILDTSTGQVIRTLAGTAGGYTQFSQDGRYLMADTALWELEPGQIIARFARNYGPVAQFSPHGTYLLTYSDPHTLSVWNMRSGQLPPPLATSITMNTDPLTARFSPSGQTLVTVDMDGRARVWAIQPDDNLPSDYQSLRMLALSRVTRSLTCQERQTYLRDIAPCAAQAHP
jgi:WD40 repeat protein